MRAPSPCRGEEVLHEVSTLHKYKVSGGHQHWQQPPEPDDVFSSPSLFWLSLGLSSPKGPIKKRQSSAARLLELSPPCVQLCLFQIHFVGAEERLSFLLFGVFLSCLLGSITLFKSLPPL